MFDKVFAQWWLTRVEPFREVPAEKLAADREAVERQQEFNQNYQTLLQSAVLPTMEALTQLLRRQRVVHRISTWGNQISVRIHLAWRWGELVISQSHEDAVSFQHHVCNEGEKRSEDSSQDFEHIYDLRDPIPPSVAVQELYFFMGRMVQDLVDDGPPPELPPGEKPPAD
ncbi:MAG: hypothetical protein ABSH20_03910 [Tepidisphaeraceae bacterium]